jgi:hypothetical protein
MQCKGRLLAREVRALLREADEAYRWNSLASGVVISPEDRPQDRVVISFADKTGEQLRSEMLEAVIEQMTRRPFDEDLCFRLTVDYGEAGNAALKLWSCAAYCLAVPFLSSVYPNRNGR